MAGIIASLIKSSLWPIAGKLFKEILMAIFLRLKWKVLLERFVSRLVSAGLRKLVKLDTNGLTGKTAADALAMLQRDDLPELK